MSTYNSCRSFLNFDFKSANSTAIWLLSELDEEVGVDVVMPLDGDSGMFWAFSPMPVKFKSCSGVQTEENHFMYILSRSLVNLKMWWFIDVGDNRSMDSSVSTKLWLSVTLIPQIINYHIGLTKWNLKLQYLLDKLHNCMLCFYIQLLNACNK